LGVSQLCRTVLQLLAGCAGFAVERRSRSQKLIGRSKQCRDIYFLEINLSYLPTQLVQGSALGQPLSTKLDVKDRAAQWC